VRHYGGTTQDSVPFRPSSWERALQAVVPAATTLLRDGTVTRPVEEVGRAGDRLVTRDDLRQACGRVDPANQSSVLSAFVLVMASGSGLTGGRRLRYTAAALQDPDRAHRVLRAGAETLRSASTPEDGSIARAHRAFRLPGVGQACFTKWFAFAGHVEGRDWQPLILDQRVYATLNSTLDVSTRSLAETKGRAARYTAYVAALHDWAQRLDLPGVTGERLEWILFQHRGAELPG